MIWAKSVSVAVTTHVYAIEGFNIDTYTHTFTVQDDISVILIHKTQGVDVI